MSEHTHVDGIYPFPAVMQTRTIETNGAAIHVRVGGHGPAVVMLHGFGTTGDMWGHLASALIEEHMVVAPDLRGLGLSSKPDGGYDKKNQAADVMGVLGGGNYEADHDAAAEKKATELSQPMNIAVADEGGNIVAHVRMDNAWIGSIDISMKKAYTSRAFDIETKELAKHSQSGGQFFGIHVSNNGKIMIFAGGIPLKLDGKVVGAIGVSGGSGDQDDAVAAAGRRCVLTQEEN